MSFEKPHTAYVGIIGQSSIIFLIMVSSIATISTSWLFELHYIGYAFPILTIGIGLYRPASAATATPHERLAIMALIGSLVVPALVAGLDGLKYIVFMAFGFSSFFIMINLTKTFLRNLFIVVSIAQLFISIFIGSFGGDSTHISLYVGSAADTHTLPILFGMIFGFYACLKDWKMAGVALLMILVAGKRSVLGASILGLGAAMVLPVFMGAAFNKGRHIFLSLSLVMTGIVLSWNAPLIYQWVSDRLAININVFTSGRYYGQYFAYRYIRSIDIWNIFVGSGLGKADGFAVQGFGGLATLIHSDYLRILIDLGLLFGSGFCAGYMYLIGKDKIGIYLVVFTCWEWLTENNLISILYISMLYICITTYRTESLRRIAIGESQLERGNRQFLLGVPS